MNAPSGIIKLLSVWRRFKAALLNAREIWDLGARLAR